MNKRDHTAWNISDQIAAFHDDQAADGDDIEGQSHVGYCETAQNVAQRAAQVYAEKSKTYYIELLTLQHVVRNLRY